jgi:UDP-N-acetylglucosamine 2-epimerase (non-hydrolysing)
MPEEINRLLTDQLADILWTPSADADENLSAENIAASRVTRVGNIMIDSFEMLREHIDRAPLPSEVGELEAFAVVTLHRPSNVDHRETLQAILASLNKLAERVPLVFPVHPRTRKQLSEFGMWEDLAANPRIHLLSPLSYVPFMRLVSQASLVVTDSGGVQEETSYLGIPCRTLRENTERPVTVLQGSNRLVTAESLVASSEEALGEKMRARPSLDLWDGRAASRIREDLRRRFSI